MVNKFNNGYALLIGVGTCSYLPWSLPVTVNDMKAIQRTLTDPSLCAYNNDSVSLLHDVHATSLNILNGLDWLARQTTDTPESTAIVYYSGHGWLDSLTGQYYLIPHDVNPLNISKTALSAEEFNRKLKLIPAKRLLVIVDSCHAEGMATSAKNFSSFQLPDNYKQIALSQKQISDLKKGRGRAVFTSSSGDEYSWIRSDKSMSIYTYHFIEALQGASNRDGDTTVRLSNIMSHLSVAVPRSALESYQVKQTPFFDMAAEDFSIAMLQGGKGLNHTRVRTTPKWNSSKRLIIERTLNRALETLSILEEQAAGYGALSIPAHKKIELEAKRLEVAELEKQLDNIGDQS